MRVLIFGPSGQVGHALAANSGKLGEVVTAGRSDADITMDPLDKDSLDKLFSDVQPNIVINAIAYTAVDKAESDQEQAFLLNSDLPGALADQCEKLDCLLIHYSTDFVFDGTKNEPWSEDDDTHPLSIYGSSKLAGEKAIEISACSYFILRTSWVYGVRGGNFLLTMLRLGREREALSIVDDQIGSPTSSHDIAMATISLCEQYIEDPETVKAQKGIYHLTSSGSVSWYGFAKSIFDSAAHHEHLLLKDLSAISSSDYPTAATRPAYSVLNCEKLERNFNIKMPNWKDSLEQCIQRLYN